jgi:hypothetical protein
MAIRTQDLKIFPCPFDDAAVKGRHAWARLSFQRYDVVYLKAAYVLTLATHTYTSQGIYSPLSQLVHALGVGFHLHFSVLRMFARPLSHLLTVLLRMSLRPSQDLLTAFAHYAIPDPV